MQPTTHANPDDQPPAQPPTERHAGALTLLQWISTGLKAALCVRINIGHAAPSPWQLFVLVAFPMAIQTGLARFEIPGDAVFHFPGWLYPLSGTGFLLFWLWASLSTRPDTLAHPAPVPAWFALWTLAMLPMSIIFAFLAAMAAREWLPIWWTGGDWVSWLIYGSFWLWSAVVAWRVTQSVTASRAKVSLVVVGVLLLEVFATWQFDSRPWREDTAAQEPAQQATLKLSQEVFEAQQALVDSTLAALVPRQQGRINVFGLVYAPFAQTVFVRESAMVASVLQTRFGATGRVVQLVNHPSVTSTIPWATRQNLHAAIQAIAEQMDTERDVLVVYLTSHGGSDFKLASSHWPLEVEDLTPQLLRTLLDDAGVRHRVIAVSACYSGGWIAPLATESSLVMTAADATHTSYGCGSKSELTFFGRALFDEQLRTSHSFEQAFAAAIPIIQQREVEGNKTDGFSNPQIHVGKDIRPVLAELERALKPGS